MARNVAYGTAALLLFSALSFAEVIPVSNPSFETLPAGGLNMGCGLGCTFSEAPIPGWMNTGSSGQFQPGTQAGDFTFFNSVPDGITTGYTNGPTISQTVIPTVQPGLVYILDVDLGWRNDAPSFSSSADLLINGVSYAATGTTPTQGNWSTFTVTYVGRAADAGDSITIQLNLTPGGLQGNFDNVLLTAVPEPGFAGMLAAGLVALAIYAVRSRSRQADREAIGRIQ